MSELPPGWVEAPVSELLQASIGGVWGKEAGSGDVDAVVIRVADFRDDGSIDFGSAPLRSVTARQLVSRQLRVGDILLEKSGGGTTKPVGRVVRMRPSSGPVVPTNFVQLLRPNDEFVDSGYLFWWLWRSHSDGTAAEFQRATTNIRNLRTQDYLSRLVPLPPLNEQRRIVAAIEEHLSRLDAADQCLGPALQRLDLLRSGLITILVERDRPRIRWSEAGRSQNGRAFPSRDYSPTGIRLLRPGNLHVSGRVEWSDTNTRLLPERYADEYPGYVVGEGEIVMNLTAQSLKDEFLGRVCVTGPGERCMLNQRIARLTPTDADSRFVLYAFKSRRFREFVNSLNTGSLIQHMFTSQLADYEIPNPPLEEQRRIVADIEARLSAIDALRASIDRAQRRSATLRAAILERAFRGELVPQDPADEPAEALLARIRAFQGAVAAPASRRKTPTNRPAS